MAEVSVSQDAQLGDWGHQVSVGFVTGVPVTVTGYPPATNHLSSASTAAGQAGTLPQEITNIQVAPDGRVAAQRAHHRRSAGVAVGARRNHTVRFRPPLPPLVHHLTVHVGGSLLDRGSGSLPLVGPSLGSRLFRELAAHVAYARGQTPMPVAQYKERLQVRQADAWARLWSATQAPALVPQSCLLHERTRTQCQTIRGALLPVWDKDNFTLSASLAILGRCPVCVFLACISLVR